MKWWVLVVFVLACLFCASTPTRRKIMHRLWLKRKDDRLWFANQFSTYYRSYSKSVVLYALIRLSRIFKVPLTMVDGSKKLLTLFEMHKIRQSRLRRILSRLIPQPDPTNPLQMIMQDYSDAEDDFEIARKSSQSDIPELTPLQEQSTVADYVRFIVEYDTMCRQVDRLRVTSALG